MQPDYSSIGSMVDAAHREVSENRALRELLEEYGWNLVRERWRLRNLRLALLGAAAYGAVVTVLLVVSVVSR